MEGKTDQESLKNAGILTGVFKGLLKASSFLTAPDNIGLDGKAPPLLPQGSLIFAFRLGMDSVFRRSFQHRFGQRFKFLFIFIPLGI